MTDPSKQERDPRIEEAYMAWEASFSEEPTAYNDLDVFEAGYRAALTAREEKPVIPPQTGAGEDLPMPYELRSARYEIRRATEELDRAGVEKYDHRERFDSTDDSEGSEWSIQHRISRLASKAAAREDSERSDEIETREPPAGISMRVHEQRRRVGPWEDLDAKGNLIVRDAERPDDENKPFASFHDALAATALILLNADKNPDRAECDRVRLLKFLEAMRDTEPGVPSE